MRPRGLSFVILCCALVVGPASCGRTRPPSELLEGSEADSPAVAVARGSALYARYCTPCHGAAGLGDGRYFATGLEPRPTDLTLLGAGELDHAKLVSWIQNGSAHFRRSALCPAWKHTLPSQDIRALASFVRSLRKANAKEREGST